MATQKKPKDRPAIRKAIPLSVAVAVLTEAGYRCAVPTCRNILALDIHHMVQVADGGGNIVENLLALCPNCHALYHRGTIKRESIFVWKSILVSLTRAFDVVALDQLLFLGKAEVKNLRVTGDGVLGFTRLIGAGLAEFELFQRNGPIYVYSLRLTSPGAQLVSAWGSGDRSAVEKVLSAPRALATAPEEE